MQFVVTPVRRARDTVLEVAGKLDSATIKELQAAVVTALEHKPALLVLDLGPARFIDSTGCRELVRTAKAGAARGVRVEVVVHPDNWKVRRVLQFVQLADLVPVHDEVPAR